MFLIRQHNGRSIRVAGFIVALFLLALVMTGTGDLFASSGWEAAYWNNRTLSGAPVLQRQEAELNHQWGGSGPDIVIDPDNFSARWKRTVYFPAGTYRLTATTDDGMRVWVDGVLIIDSWWDSQVHSLSSDVYLPAGDHQITVEYYEAGGEATARLSWAIVGGPPAISNWRGEYYNNVSLSGAPVLVRDEAQVNFNWGAGTPAWNIVNSDFFSARWSRSIPFTPGRYRFSVTADDGVRLWVNNQLLINQWRDQPATTYTADIDLPGGSIPITMEYYDSTGGAVAQLSWMAVSDGTPVTINHWRGEYFNNKFLSGAPALVRDDAQVSFNWGDGSPAPGIISHDSFSSRWTRTLQFNPGRYRFTASSDDGVRVWVNNQLVIDQWSDHPVQTYAAEIDLPGGAVAIRIEYYDSVGAAEVAVNWATVTAAPPPPAPGSPIATVRAYRLNVRSGPGVSHSIITAVNRGVAMELLGRNAITTWAKVRLANGTQGWASVTYLTTSYPLANLPVLNEGASTPPGGSASGTVATHFLNVRSGPGAGYSVIATVAAGQVVSMTHRNTAATWVKVVLPNGIQGWVNASYLATSASIINLPVAG